MGTLTLRPYSPTDPLRIAPREDFRIEHEAAGSPLFGPERVEGLCWTLTEGDRKWARPLACGGLEPNGQGRWTAWLYASDLSPRGWVKVAQAFLVMVLQSGAHRVEMTVRAPVSCADWPRSLGACAFAERLGLKREGLMRGYTPDGADYWLFGGVF